MYGSRKFSSVLYPKIWLANYAWQFFHDTPLPHLGTKKVRKSKKTCTGIMKAIKAKENSIIQKQTSAGNKNLIFRQFFTLSRCIFAISKPFAVLSNENFPAFDCLLSRCHELLQLPLSMHWHLSVFLCVCIFVIQHHSLFILAGIKRKKERRHLPRLKVFFIMDFLPDSAKSNRVIPNLKPFPLDLPFN